MTVVMILFLAAAVFYTPIAICLLWFSQEIASARIDKAQNLGQVDLPIATLLLDFTVLARDREPFPWFFTRTMRRGRVDRYAAGNIMPVRFNPLEGVPSPRPVHFRRADFQRPARLWLLRGGRFWIVSAGLALVLASLLVLVPTSG